MRSTGWIKTHELASGEVVRCLFALIGIVPVALGAATPGVAEMLVQNPPVTVPSS